MEKLEIFDPIRGQGGVLRFQVVRAGGFPRHVPLSLFQGRVVHFTMVGHAQQPGQHAESQEAKPTRRLVLRRHEMDLYDEDRESYSTGRHHHEVCQVDSWNSNTGGRYELMAVYPRSCNSSENA